MKTLLMKTVLLLAACLVWQVQADDLLQLVDNPAGKVMDKPMTANQEQILSPDVEFTLWVQDETLFKPHEEDRIEMRKVLKQEAETFKLDDVVKPITFKAGQADIPESYVTELREILNSMKHRANVRLHFIGHTDSDPLGPQSAAKYGDNVGLSRTRAAYAAEYFQRALDLPPEAISFDGVGASRPIASNDTLAGKSRNRRVEVQVWYDEITDRVAEESVLIPAAKLNRIKICRKETVCKLHYTQGNAKRAKLKNLIAPLLLEEGQGEIPASFIRQIREVLKNLGNKKNLVVRFVGHTDTLPLNDLESRIYGTHEAFSKARARRVALAIQDVLGLPNDAISTNGKGSSRPVAPNDSMKGRALNRRVEVEFWYDDPFEQLSDEAQTCPEAEAAETITRVYEPPSGSLPDIRIDHGQPVISPGYPERLQRIYAEALKQKPNARLNFIGYTSNQRLDRRAAMIYGDDIGLSTARARRTMEVIKQQLQLNEQQVEFEGRGFVQSDDVVNAGFIQLDSSRVEIQIIYDELAILEEDEGLEITRLDQVAKARNPYALNLMRITVDGDPIYDPYMHVADLQRCTDVALEKAAIKFSFDNLELKPRLNVTAWPTTVRYEDNPATDTWENRIQFQGYSNYTTFIAQAEVRIFHAEQSTRQSPLAAIKLDDDWKGEWQANIEHFKAPLVELKYLIRVYNKAGLFDETTTLPLWLVDKLDNAENDQDAGPELLAGFGENHLALQNIPLSGGAVSVNGEQIPDKHSVWLAGRRLPVNDLGSFVSEEIFPTGMHSVEVAVLDQQGNGELFLRELELNKNDWFYVGMADLTLVKDDTNGPAALLTGDQTHYDNDLSLDGRMAFYIKGKFNEDWKLTASADTREGPLDDIFSNFMDKSPDQLFRRMDPDYYTPTFGDDSTVEEDAPTMGKFYAKLQQHNNYGLWGNFRINYTDNNLAHIDRELYGANLHYQGDSVTSFGEQRLLLDGFAAEPGTLGGRDEFRGTGGSLYFLRHQDIMTGSDRVRIEIRDKDSGLVVSVKNLVPAVDYDIDYIQGRILLSEPLAATVSDDQVIANSANSGNPVYLVARYEYTPGFAELDQVELGGRVHYWLNDQLKLGLTANRQRQSGNEQSLDGVDVTLRKNTATWVKLEVANTTGQGQAALNSNDGGFNFDELDQGLNVDGDAEATRIEASAELQEIFTGVEGVTTFYMQNREAGFSAPGQITATEINQLGTSLTMPITDRIDFKLKADYKDQDQGLETSAVDVSGRIKLDSHWQLTTAGRFDSRQDQAATIAPTQLQGDRFDIGMEASYDSLEKWLARGFAQLTATNSGTREENNRVGLGAGYRVTDRFKLDGELSAGDLGTGAQLSTDYLVSDRSNLYLNYVLENERTDNGVRSRRGNMSSGFRTQYSDSASLYIEENYTHGDVPNGLTHALGVDLAPYDRWNIGANMELGELQDDKTGLATRRAAYGMNLGYAFDTLKLASALEYRTDETDDATGGTTTRTTWLMKNSIKLQLNPDWRLLGKLNISDSQSSQGEFYDGNFIDAVLGYAHRPVNNDRWNTLFKYTYFYNVPTVDQVNLQNTAAEFIQKSHIFSLDTLYDLSSRWSLGLKYAYRMGQVSQDRANPEYFDSRAALSVLRVDWHFIKRWDVLLEARQLDLPDAQDRRSGALLGIYRHLGDHIKFGLGYNFTDFSDDLTDLDYDSQGFFLNLIGKF